MALVLDGVNQYAEAPFSWSQASDFSIAIKHKRAVYDASAGLVCAANSAGPDNYFAGYFSGGSSQIGARERDPFDPANYDALGADATDGEWNSLVIAYDSATDTLTLYQDSRSGVTVVGSSKSNGGDVLFAGALQSSAPGPFVFFEGKIAAMRGWTRKLSAAEALDYNTATTLAEVDAITGGTGPDLISDGTGATLFNSPTFDSDTPFAPSVAPPSNSPVLGSPADITRSTTKFTFTFDSVANTGDPVTGYEIRIDGGGWSSIGNPSPKEFTLSTLFPGETYNTPGVELRAVNSGGPGPASSAVAFSTKDLVVVPANLSAGSINESSALLDWSAG